MNIKIASSKAPFLALGLALVALNSWGQTLRVDSVIDSLGTTKRLEKPAARVVSLSPSATEALFAVGATVVGNTTYCNFPPEAKQVAKIGGFSARSMSVEKILSLRPDLIVSSGRIHAAVVDQLARYGIPVYAYSPASFVEIGEGLRNLGTLTGNPARGKDEADRLAAELAKIAAIVATIPENERLKVFWEVYDEPLMTCGSSTFQHAIVAAAGGKDIFTDLSAAWPTVSGEEVIARAPQVIMGADDHGEKMTYSSIASRPGWSQIPAVKDKRIVLLPTELVSGPGPRIAKGVYLAAKALYPRLFP
ncbi:MAG: iron complex transport system substrate-binding protein [Spirochaetes bacterium]|nr:MAG: iron complex transport system substrate-binding protein [Spirochaetota bacterium]